MNARGTRRPHSRKPRSTGRVKGGNSGTGSEAPGCAVVLFLVGLTFVAGTALTFVGMAVGR